MEFGLLAGALGATSSPPTLLVLNACETTVGAEILLSAVKLVVAMSDGISDKAAATFAEQFYAAIASAQPISVALEQAKIAMKAARLKDADLPVIIVRRGVDPKKLVLIKRR
jgi:CHAT domain-containing protein